MNKILIAQTNRNTPVNTTNRNSNSGNSNSANRQQTTVPQIKDPFGGKTLSGIASQGINILLSFIVIAAVVVIIIAGFRMVAGGGNPDQIAKAKKTIIWAIIGLAVAFMSFAIVRIVQSLL